MITLKRTGSMASVIAAIRDVPARVVPYAAATALTRVAKGGQAAVVEQMPRVFDRPTRYTLNSLRVRPATVAKPQASVEVKSDATNNGTPAEDYLFPGVFGGTRREKRFERAMRYAGLLQRGEYAIPASGAPLDDKGNLRRGEIQRILTATRSAFDKYQRKSDSPRSRRNAKNAPYFAARIGRRFGVWARSGPGQVKPVLIFTTRTPQYRSRLHFGDIVERYAEQHFEAEFRRAAAAILAKGPRR